MKVTLGETIDNIGYYENVLSDEMCDKLIEWAKDRENTLTIGEALQGDIVSENYPVFNQAINENLQKFIKDFDINSFPDDFGIEPFHIKGYVDEGENPEQYQIDVGSHDMARRFVGLFFVLNELEEPGEIQFYRQNTTIKPKKGSVFVYPSLWTHPQLRIMPKSGVEYVLGTYLHYM